IAGKIEYAAGVGETAPVREASVTWGVSLADWTYTNDQGEFVLQFSSPPEFTPLSFVSVYAISDPRTTADRPVARSVQVDDGWFRYDLKPNELPGASHPTTVIDLTGAHALGYGDLYSFTRRVYNAYDAALSAAQVHEQLIGVQTGRAHFALTSGGS